MSWCKAAHVNKRLESLAGKGFDDSDIPTRIKRAERFLRNKLLARYGLSVVTGWDTTTPTCLSDLCADLTAFYLKSDFMDDYKRSSYEKEAIFEFLKAVVSGKADLIDDSGNRIAPAIARSKFNKAGQTSIFSMGNTGDDTIGDGTLDGYGPSQTDAEGD